MNGKTRTVAASLLSLVAGSLAMGGAALAQPAGSVVTVTSDMAGMGMDPAQDNTGNVKVFTDEIHLNGIMQEPDGSLIPGAAVSWEVSPDLHSWIWTVREGVKFHDGSVMTAEDFAWSWHRAILSEDSTNVYKTAYGPLIEDIYAEGNTVIVRTKRPEPLMPLWWPTYDNQVGYVLSKAQFEREGLEGIRERPIGAGSFKLVERNLASRYVDLEAWEEHYCCVPQIQNLRVLEVPELSTRLALLRTGQADIVEATPAARQEIENAGMQIYSGLGGSLSVMYYFYQHFPNNPFNDARVREAMSIAVDRGAILERIYDGQGGALHSFHAGPGTAGYPADLTADPYDPERAKELMTEAGYPDGFPVRIMTYSFDGDFPDMPTLSQAVLGYLQEINITGEVQVVEWIALRDSMVSLLNDVCGPDTVVCTAEDAANLDVAAQQPYTLMIRGDRARYNSLRQNRSYQSTLANLRPVIQYPEVDEALEAVIREFDLDKQRAAFEEYNRLLRRNFYNAPLIYTNNLFGVSNRVENWEPIAGRPYPNNHWTISIE